MPRRRRRVRHTQLLRLLGLDSEPPVISEGRSARQTSTGFRTEAAWPPPGSESFRDFGDSTEEITTCTPAAETNWLYRDGVASAKPVPPGEPVSATVTFEPQDQTFEAGHSVGLLGQGSNTVWAVPDDPGAGYTLRLGRRGSSLVLPLAL
jgi:hypothetical protein